MAKRKVKSRDRVNLEPGVKVRYAKNRFFRYADWPEGAQMHPGLRGVVVAVRQPFKGAKPFVVIRWENGVETAQEGNDLVVKGWV
jgi:hypothetical protein